MSQFWVGLAVDAANEGAFANGEDPELVGPILGGMAHAIYSDMIVSDRPFQPEEYQRREDIFLQIIKHGLFA